MTNLAESGPGETPLRRIREQGESLSNDYAKTSTTQHSGLLGRRRETLLRTRLAENMPGLTVFDRSQEVHSSDGYSPEMDVLITLPGVVDPEEPVPVDLVVADVEAKSDYQRTDLVEDFAKIQRLKSLPRDPAPWECPKIGGAMFGFNGVGLDTLARHFRDLCQTHVDHPETWPNSVWINNVGFVLWVLPGTMQQRFCPELGDDLLVVPCRGELLTPFVYCMTDLVAHSKGGGSWLNPWAKQIVMGGTPQVIEGPRR